MPPKRFILSTLLFFMTYSCDKQQEEVMTHVHNATIKVNVYQQQINIGGQVNNIAIQDVTVDLFKTSYDRDNNTNKVLTRYTDSSGLAQFYNLVEEYYYLRASHAAFGEVLEETSTPDGSVSFVEMVF